MIDRTHELPVIRQCQILSLARSTAYYRPQDANAADLALMHRIDELHLEHPFAGSPNQPINGLWYFGKQSLS